MTSENTTGCRQCPFSRSGYTILEMLIGILISSIILGGVILVVVRVSVAAGVNVAATRLNQQARLSMDQITRELQRAGYLNWYEPWDDCVDNSTPHVLDDINADGAVDILDFYQCSLPAIGLVGDISLWDFPSPGDATSGTPTPCTSNCDCILYSYDFNEDGAQGIGAGAAGNNQNTANFELYGFRWNNGAVEMRTSGHVHGCSSGTWRDLNDANVEINGMGFSLVYAIVQGIDSDSTMFQLTGNGTWNGNFQSSCTPVDSDGTDPTPVSGDTICLLSRTIDISMQARLVRDSAVVVALNSTVKNKNDYLNTP